MTNAPSFKRKWLSASNPECGHNERTNMTTFAHHYVGKCDNMCNNEPSQNNLMTEVWRTSTVKVIGCKRKYTTEAIP